MTEHPSLTVALHLASRRIPIFFCDEKKRPVIKGGFKAAVTDEPAVRYMWRRNPGPLVGVPTGPASGFDALDIDPKNGGDSWLLENERRMPGTWVSRTRSGGEHWLFRHAPGVRNSQSKIAPGVDTRGEGGYIIWWPGLGGDVVRRNRLAEWPAWLLELILPKPNQERQRGTWRTYTLNDSTCARRIIQRQIDRVARAAPGERHKQLRNAALTIGGVLNSDPAASRGDVERALLSAVIHAGGDDVDRSNAEKTIIWGLDNGALRPLTIGGQDAR